MWNLPCNKWETYASGPQNTTPSKEKANTWIFRMKNRQTLLTYFIFNHLHHIVLWFCWKALSNFCVFAVMPCSVFLFIRHRQHQRNKQQDLSQTNHCDNHLQSNERYFKRNILDNVPNVKIGYNFTKLSFQENNWKQIN